MQPVLAVDLAALRANYRLLKNRHAKTQSAAVVKANAYGLGVKAVSHALWDEGCRDFFVATLEEGAELRSILPDAHIGVFNGLLAGEEQDFLQLELLPVLNELSQLERWHAASKDKPAIIHLDSGMTRLGFTHGMLQQAIEQYTDFCKTRVQLLMSHLACANEPAHPKNKEQLTRFETAKALLPSVRTSLCNSSGFFLPQSFHQDLGRPGCALYGINPTEQSNPMAHVATLSAPIIQIRHLDRDETVGYGATYPAMASSKIAITALGYADGWLRMQSNTGHAFINGARVPLAGRVSMDMVALDVSTLNDAQLAEATHAEFICKEQPVDHIATACNTIGYEIFTRLGRRILRQYQ